MMLLISGTGKVFYIRDTNADFHTQFGYVSREDLKKAESGDVVKTNTGKELFVVAPSFSDIFRKIKRGPQVIPLKDIGTIISFTGVGRDSKVVDAGSGSGAVACFLGNIVGEVFSYELRPDFFRIASENASKLGLKNVFVKNKDVYEGIDEREVDLVVLDLPEPWKAIESASSALKVGGFLVSYSPTVPQVSDFVTAVSADKRFLYLKTVEVIERDWEVNERKVRPKSQAIGHSGFMSFSRKIR